MKIIDFVLSQEQLGTDFELVLFDNLWDMYQE